MSSGEPDSTMEGVRVISGEWAWAVEVKGNSRFPSGMTERKAGASSVLGDMVFGKAVE